MITARFLILCGADVTATDFAFNTPLHFLSAFTIRDSEARTENQYELYNMIINARMSYPDLVNSPLLASSSFSDGTQVAKEGCTSVSPSVTSTAKCHPLYGGECAAHLDAVNIFGQTAMQSSASVLSDVIFRNSKHVFSLKCFAARVVHKSFLFCESCQKKTGAFELNNSTAAAIASASGGSSSLAEKARAVKLLRYSETMAEMTRAPRGTRMRFPHLDSYSLHGITYYDHHLVWHVMVTFAQKLNIDLDLAQFVEMHGPCKFVHFPSPPNTPTLPFQCSLC